jgi:uncharacterized protein YbjT (DUF2867 family)
MQKTALIVGASGLVGSKLLALLVKDQLYREVIVVTRRMVVITSEKIVQHVLNFDHLNEHQEKFKADDVFCCLGTTMKKAGSKENFYQVDFKHVLNIAKLTAANKAESFNLITAMGASKTSLFYYSRVKGEVEEAVSKLKFKRINIFRPSLILGDRSDPRPMEKFGQVGSRIFSFLFVGPLKKYKAIEAKTIASAMLKAAKLKSEGITIYNSDEIEELGK